MSNTLRFYTTLETMDGKTAIITAFVGGKWGKGIQITIGGEYCCLAENQVKDLIFILKKRLVSAKGFSATDTSEEKTIKPKAKKEAEK